MITSQEMRQLEDNCGIPKQVIMENAGRGVADILRKKFDILNKQILIVAYHGNNGGDGFVAARHLCDEAEIDVLFIGDEENLKNGALLNFKKIENNEKIQILDLEAVDFSDYDIIIDAIFGTGIRGEIKDPLATLITNLNKAKAFKVSVDIPTGLDPGTGDIVDKCVNADLIVTFHDLKKGLEKFKDKAVVADIGLPKYSGGSK